MLAKHIHTLLSQESAVIIPGLGRLYSRYESSTIRGAELLPPHRDILFDDVEDSDPENKLARFIDQQEKEDTAAATQIEAFVARIKTDLAEKQRAEVPTLGTFTAQSGRVSFEAANTLRESPEAFGLAALSLKPVVSSQKKPEAATPEPDEATQPTPPPEPPPAYTQEDMKKPEGKTSANNELITWLVIIPLVFVFAFLVWLFVQRGSSESTAEDTSDTTPPITLNEEETPKPETTEPEPEEVVEEPSDTEPEPEEVVEDTSNPTTDTKPAEPEPEPVEQTRSEPAEVSDEGMLTEKTGQYYLILFSSDNRAKAQELRQKLIGEGENAYLMPHNARQGWVRVAVGGYATAQEAVNAGEALSGYQSWVKKW